MIYISLDRLMKGTPIVWAATINIWGLQLQGLSREHLFEARLRPDWSNTIRTEDYLYRQGVRM
jgi:hypothetical protein